VVLIISILGHMYAAFTLWSRARKARGGLRRYHSSKARLGVQRTYASYTLRCGGVVILLFVIYHLLHLTWNVVHPGGAAAEPYDRLVNGFQIWSVVLVYTIAVIAVGLHVRHGTWSALTTLGANTSSLARRRLNALAYAVAGLLTVGFLLPPFAILFGFVS
jgi:succinate dehydrogenase / fumarate reductase cytochrome b subunit